MGGLEMNRPLMRLIPVLMLLLASTPLPADDITGKDTILCASVQAALCSAEGECETGSPWNWDIPQFVIIDMKDNVIRTTEASGVKRVTPFKNARREEGLIFIQGVQNFRAFSLVIAEEDGLMSAAIAMDGLSINVFGACTPVP
jgi:hypothetical protein